ncbi:glycerol-3-phosphate 1-O-acyltransferase [Acinetobacter sp. Ac_877]|uniref:glycerol-3-phosphate 1-O-acyltransferase PlsB n=1 Tax=Acinetobacter portensis TaxID=1839785 RepID=UPI00128C332E|nr:glycerol-3-phosphate 1-O-acyltransferase PlsB [Acinetobacter portensis]MPW40506.1 glycerol-3-phosphate 1-O-acyltransferase [Acinetobacter portensis]
MSNTRYSKIYRNLTKKILDKIVSPQVLGNTAELEQKIAQQSDKTKVCYVLEDSSLSNTVLIDKEALERGLPSVFSQLNIADMNEADSILALNETEQKNESYHYSAKLIRLIEALEKNNEYDIELVPVTVLWGRSPAYENSWLKALFADAWAKPNKIKQTINVSLYGRDNYIEFHKALSLRELIEKAKAERPNFSPAHLIVQELDESFHKHKEAILGPDLSDRRNLINKLMKTEAVQTAIRKESIDKKVSMFEAENRAKGYLTEIVSDFSYSTLRFAELALTKLWTQLYDGIEVHNFDTVRELAKDYEIVYTPCHRSHIDYLLLSYVIFNRGLMVPHIAAGINLNLPVVGQIMRGAGAYFIRRTFSGNALYSSVFKEYLHSLLLRNTPLEYFIEGGRSRTGLLLPPKKGMLAMTIESHLRGSTKPIAFIPTYFGYEKLMEGTSYLNELNGKPKEAESLWGILNSARKIEKVFGQVYVNFGEPILLNEVLKDNDAENVKLNLNDDLPESVSKTVDQTANEILENINKAVVINPISIISLILLNTENHTLSQSNLVEQIGIFRDVLKSLRYDDRMIITDLSDTEIIEYAHKLKQVEIFTENEQQFVRVSESQKILLSYFSNNILHCFILPSLICALIVTQQFNSVSSLKMKIHQLYPFFKEEFFLKWNDAELNDEIDRILNKLSSLNAVKLQHDMIEFSSSGNQQIVMTFAVLSQLSLNNMVLISQLIPRYSSNIELDIKVLEKMAKVVLKRLSTHQDFKSGYYFDSATLRSYINTLKHMTLVNVAKQGIQPSAEFELITKAHLSWYNPELQQLIYSFGDFAEKELKQLKDTVKK